MTHDKRDMTKYEEVYQTIVSALSYHDEHGEQTTGCDKELMLLKELVHNTERKGEI